MPLTRPRLALALSGGGIRAAVFHLGVLRQLAEQGLLEKVAYVSTVSGGSLLAGLVFRYSGYTWPSSERFLGETYTALTDVLLGADLQWRYLARLFLLPWNWARFAFRANVLAETIRDAWDIQETLERLPAAPVWAINGTTMETGRRWRFRGDSAAAGESVFDMGDGELGYTTANTFPIASAMATSAAFPGGISPLRLSTRKKTWTKPNYDVPGHPSNKVPARYGAYHIADGGVYDNLGLEPLFDISRNSIRVESGCDCVVVSDAGAPLGIQRWHFVAQVLGFSKRTADIMSAQTRNLRVRGFVHFLATNPGMGVLLDISQSAAEAISRARTRRDVVVPRELAGHRFLTKSEVDKVARYETTLSPPSRPNFALIERHGYEVAMVQLGLYG